MSSYQLNQDIYDSEIELESIKESIKSEKAPVKSIKKSKVASVKAPEKKVIVRPTPTAKLTVKKRSWLPKLKVAVLSAMAILITLFTLISKDYKEITKYFSRKVLNIMSGLFLILLIIHIVLHFWRIQ